jgi:hypothetical protein
LGQTGNRWRMGKTALLTPFRTRLREPAVARQGRRRSARRPFLLIQARSRSGLAIGGSRQVTQTSSFSIRISRAQRGPFARIAQPPSSERACGAHFLMLNNQHQPVRLGIGDRAGPLASLAKAVSISERRRALLAILRAVPRFRQQGQSRAEPQPDAGNAVRRRSDNDHHGRPKLSVWSNRSWDLLPRPGGGR